MTGYFKSFDRALSWHDDCDDRSGRRRRSHSGRRRRNRSGRRWDY